MTLTSDSPAGVVASRSLSLALGQGGGLSGGAAELNWSVGRFADGELITIMTDESAGWNFGPAPKDIGTMGFGQGFIQQEPLGTNLTDFIDPISNTDWFLERENSSRVVDENDGIRCVLTSFENDGVVSDTTLGGGWLTWASQNPLIEDEKLYVTSLSKADWGFINSSSSTPIASVLSVDSPSKITLTEPWMGASNEKLRVIIAPDLASSDTIREAKMYLAVLNGSSVATLHMDSLSDFYEGGVSIGDAIMLWAAVQWKGLRPAANIFEFTDPNLYWKNNNGFYGWPLNGAITGALSGSNYDLAGQPITKKWCRTESEIIVGVLGGNGVIKERALYPEVGDGFQEYTEKSFIMHSSAYRWQYFQFQEYAQNLTSAKLWRTDTAFQVGTFARFELADGPTPETTTVATWLPPSGKNWHPTKVSLVLWKGLLQQYSGNYIHAYDFDGLFRGAVQL